MEARLSLSWAAIAWMSTRSPARKACRASATTSSRVAEAGRPGGLEVRLAVVTTLWYTHCLVYLKTVDDLVVGFRV
jgi:hypothetical protein